MVTVHGAGKGDGESMWVMPNRGAHQRFSYDNGKIVTFCNLVLGIQGDTPVPGAKVVQQQRRDVGTQRWELHNDGTVRIAGTFLCLDHEGGCRDEKTMLVVYPHNGSDSQKWKIHNIESSQGSSQQYSCPPYNPSAEKYSLVSEMHGMVLDVKGASRDDGAVLLVFGNHGRDNQKFSFQNGMIFCAHSGKALTVEGNITDRAAVVQRAPTGAPNQKWDIHNDSTIRLAGTSYCLDIENASRAQGARVIIWTHHGHENQK